MTKDEVLRLALEALESTGENNGYHGVTQYFDETMVDQAIKAVKAALEAKDEPVVWNEGVPAMLPKQKEGETFIVSYEPKLEAKDEPVAWVCDGEVRSLWWDKNQALDRNAGHEFTPLYAAPPQHTWIGLTAEEREQVQTESYGKVPHHVALIAAVEAKLKEKNT